MRGFPSLIISLFVNVYLYVIKMSMNFLKICRYFETQTFYPKLPSFLPLFPLRFYYTSQETHVYSLCFSKVQNSLIIVNSYHKEFATFISKSRNSSTNISYWVVTSADGKTVQFTHRILSVMCKNRYIL